MYVIADYGEEERGSFLFLTVMYLRKRSSNL